MKLNFLFLAMLLSGLSSAAQAAESAGLRFINSRGYVVCGTNTSDKTLAYKDEDGVWAGMDADICRNFAEAILGNSEAFRLENVSQEKAGSAIRSGKIDFMLGNTSLSAKQEISSPMAAADIIYYDKQVFAAREENNATSMETFRGAKVCVSDQSVDLANVVEYNYKYALEFKILPFPNIDAAKQAFYLKRCQLISGSEVLLKNMETRPISKEKITILPEVIAYRPIYAYTAKNNPDLRIIGKWIINAPKLAEQQGISSKNIEAFIGIRNASLQNLLGQNPALWNAFALRPEWLKKAITARGNFGEMFERNLGTDSSLKIERDKNYLIEKGGLITAQPFI